jgi:hypothetical protein
LLNRFPSKIWQYKKKYSSTLHTVALLVQFSTGYKPDSQPFHLYRTLS